MWFVKKGNHEFIISTINDDDDDRVDKMKTSYVKTTRNAIENVRVVIYFCSRILFLSVGIVKGISQVASFVLILTWDDITIGYSQLAFRDFLKLPPFALNMNKGNSYELCESNKEKLLLFSSS
ncbi:CLUMA_CG018723, isoform A [Clunio marinus]|uniref:CLUMA_CG018723, isoform A n=1 Tax=Clunio marinus TaxID=568069 RepID=A0A1J1IZI8_9DIPT|nr:CLUMA_CG018723, isoform A [Clunio marinus]